MPLAIVALAALRFVAPYEALATNIVIYGLFTLGCNLLLGYTGLLSFGQAAFFGLGAYGCGIFIVHAGFPVLPAIGLGIVVAVLGAALIGAMVIRSRGIYFAMVTLALGQCVSAILYQMDGWTGGENGLRGIAATTANVGLFTVNLIDPTQKFYFVLAFVVVALALVERPCRRPWASRWKPFAKTRSAPSPAATMCRPRNGLSSSYRARSAASPARFTRFSSRSCRSISSPTTIPGSP